MNGRQLAIKHYDWQVVLKKMDAIYQQDTNQEIMGESMHAQIA
jgi:hypothetical protein